VKTRVGARSDIGRLRKRNEDAYLVREPLFAVADGMGGHRGGAEASAVVVEMLERLRLPPAQPLQALVEEIKRANQEVLERGQTDRHLEGMGTTLTAVVAQGDTAYLAHVGDSRAYLLRDDALQQLTQDHTLVQRMVTEGRLSPEEAHTHPQRSILTNALGVDDDIPVDELTLPVRAGDRILLCTDGLTGMIGEERIHQILASEQDPQPAADRLVEETNRAGGEDNVTVVVVDFLDDGRGAQGDGQGPSRALLRRSNGPATGEPVAVEARDEVEAVVDQQPEDGATTARARIARRDEEDRGQRSRRAGRWRRITVWAAVVAALAAGGLVGLRVYVDRQWYVGEANGKVAIYNGIPTEVAGFNLSHVHSTTTIDAAEASRLQPWKGLQDGITENSLQDAQEAVAQIMRDLARTRSGGSA
jgi:PPM family protein phosphatase